MKKISKNAIILCFIAIYLIIVNLMFIILGYFNTCILGNFKNFGKLKNKFKITFNEMVCEIKIDINSDMSELSKIANKFDVKLFVAEPQRLIHYLNENELELLEKNDNSIIRKYFNPNKIIFGVFEPTLNENKTVSISLD
jgi:hypothetical protein